MIDQQFGEMVKPFAYPKALKQLVNIFALILRNVLFVQPIYENIKKVNINTLAIQKQSNKICVK